MDPRSFPETVNFYALLGVEAIRRKSAHGGAFRLWTLSKALDIDGSGIIHKSQLEAYSDHLGVNKRTFQRWYKKSLDLGLFIPKTNRSGENKIILVNAATAGYILGCSRVGNRKAIMQALDLIGDGWRSRVWAAFETSFDSRPIARAKIHEVTGVSERTQRYRDSEAGVKRQRNYAKTDISKDYYSMLREFSSRSGLFVSYSGKVMYRLPDTRTSPNSYRGPVSRARKHNKALRKMNRENLDGLFQMQQPQFLPTLDSSRSCYVRLFHETERQRRAAQKKLAGYDHDVEELYQAAGQSSAGSQLWKPYSIK